MSLAAHGMASSTLREHAFPAAPPVVATSSIFDKFIALKSFLVDVVKTLFTDSKKEEITTTTTTTTSVEPPTTAFPTTLRSKASFEHFTRRLDDLTTTESTTLEAITEAVTTTTLTTVSTTEAPLTLKFLNVHEEMIAEHTSSTTTLTTLKNAATILSSTSTSTTATTAMSTMSTNVPELQVNAASSTSEADTTSKPSSTKTHFSSTASVAVTTVGVKITQPQLGSKLDESTTDQAGASTTTTSPSTTATEVLSSTATPFETTTSSLLQNMLLEKSSVSRFSTPIQDSTTSTTTTPSSTLSVILVKQPQLERKLDAETSTTSETSSTAIISPSSTADTPSVAASTVKAATTTLSVDVFPFSADPRLFEVSSTASTKTDSSTDVTEVREILLTTSTSTSTTTPVTVPSETTISSNASTTTAVAEQIKEVTITSTTAPETSTEPVYSTVTSTVETKSKQTPKVIIWTISEPLEEITSENSRIAVESEISSSSLLTKGLATSTTPAPIEQSTTSPVLDEGSLFASVEQTIPLVKLITTTVHSTVEEVATAPSTLAGLESSRATKLLEEKLKEGTTTATTVEDTTQMSVLSTNSEDLVKTSPSSPIVTEKPEILTEEPLKLIQLTLFQEANPVSTPKPVNISDFAESEDAVLPVIPKDMNEAFSIGQRVMEQLEKGLPEDLEQVEVSAALGKEKEEEEEYEDSGEVDAPETAEEASTADAPPLNATTTTPEITTPALPTTVPTSFASLSSKVTPTTVEVVEVTTVPSTTTRFQVSEITTTSSASIPETSTAEVTPNHHHLSIDDLEEEVLPPVIVTGVLASTGLLAAKALQKTASNHKEASTPQPPPKLHHHVETLRSSAETSATSKPVHHVLVPVHMKGNRNPPGIKPQLATPLPPLRTTPTMVPVMHTSPQPMKVSSKPAHPKDEVQSTTKPPVDPTLVALETHLELSVPPPPPTDEQIQVNPSAQDHEMTTRAPTTKRRPTTRRKTTRHHHRRTKKPRTNTQSPVSNPGHTTTARPGNAVAASRKFRTRHFIVPTTVATTTTSTTTTTTTETPTTAFVAERIEIVRPRLGSRRNRTRPVLMGREETRVLLAERFRQQQARLEERRQESRRRGQSGSAVRVVSGNVENRTPVVESFKQPAPAFQQQPQQPQALCIDRSPWCGAWIHGNPSICQISSIYMRRDCARSCRYCS